MKRSGGTLFSYFQSSPTTQSAKTTPAKRPKNVTQKTPGSTAKAGAHAKTKKSTAAKKAATAPPTLIGGARPVLGLLLWGKMEGHPVWPAMVCPHPCGRLMRGRKAPEVHVQFFGQPPTRGWVPLKDSEIFSEATVTVQSEACEKEEGWEEAVQECRSALAMEIKERAGLMVDIPSEGEDEWSGEEGGGECNGDGGVATPSGRKRARPLLSSGDDSEGEIGVRKTLLGRPKRSAAMAISERVRGRAKKRANRVLDSDASEDDYCPGGSDETSSAEEEEEEVESEAASVVESESESVVTPAKKQRTSATPAVKTPKTPASLRIQNGHLFTPSPSQSLSPSPSLPATPTLRQQGPHKHELLEWLSEETVRDKNNRRKNDPNYNPRTLKIPPDYLKNLTPALRQWWDIKSNNFDTVLMFKVGKFYELYHMDASTGVKELGLVFMKGDFAHSGFPEVAFGRYAQALVQKGYKVARIEQTETPAMMEERVKKLSIPTKFDRVVRREVCSVITKGTQTLGFFDGDVTDSEASFLLAIKEKPLGGGGESSYGVCFVDTCIGKFHLGQFDDDRQCSRLRTLVAHYPPAQVLYQRGNLSVRSMQVVNQLLAAAIRDCLTPNSEFYDAGKTLKILSEGVYFSAGREEGSEEDGLQWPDVLRDMLAKDDCLGLTASDNFDLAVSALGACVWCLKRCCIDKELLTMCNFELYEPVDVTDTGRPGVTSSGYARQRMVLDDITLSNLDVLDNHGRTAGTLLERIDHCATPFGKRTLKQWLCAPLCSPQAIDERLDAVADLVDKPSLAAEAKEVLRSLPDLERLLRKIHTMGSSSRIKDHPEGRAIFYEEKIYSRRKITDFIVALEGFKASLNIAKVFSAYTDCLDSRLLKSLVLLAPSRGGRFPDMADLLGDFERAFDHAKARKEGTIVPTKGVNPTYDRALSDVARHRHDLDEYLQKQRKRLGCRTIYFWGSGRNRFQLEVPETALSRHIPDEYDLKSQKKGFRRYWTADIEAMLEQLVEAEERRDAAVKDSMRALFHSFSEHFGVWESAVQCLSLLDALMSLATYSSCSEGQMCRPKITATPIPFLDIRAGRHPCVAQTYTGDDFIPNDVGINPVGVADGSVCVIVTGPNMGGKSTLLRQTGLIVILAQLGCFVPAESCQFSPVDRVFTRLGASDRIMSGESTFFVELTETSTILQHATKNSLVLLDELGRGTATYDGTAIACAVVRELAERTQCRSLFSTHYHSLVEEFSDSPHIALGHMACMVGDEAGEEEEEEEHITFLYKFIDGACPKSYGFNAARLAGIPTEVIQVARKKAEEFEQSTELQKIFRQLMLSSFEVESLSRIQQKISLFI